MRRRPYVGEGADGCLRSAEIDRSEADLLLGPGRARALESASRWEAQAIAEALEVEVLAGHYLEAWTTALGGRIVARCKCGHETRPGGHRAHLADEIAAWFSGRAER